MGVVDTLGNTSDGTSKMDEKQSIIAPKRQERSFHHQAIQVTHPALSTQSSVCSSRLDRKARRRALRASRSRKVADNKAKPLTLKEQWMVLVLRIASMFTHVKLKQNHSKTKLDWTMIGPQPKNCPTTTAPPMNAFPDAAKVASTQNCFGYSRSKVESFRPSHRCDRSVFDRQGPK